MEWFACAEKSGSLSLGRAASRAGLCWPPQDGVRHALASPPSAHSPPQGQPRCPLLPGPCARSWKQTSWTASVPVAHAASPVPPPAPTPSGDRHAEPSSGQVRAGTTEIPCSLGLCPLTLALKALGAMANYGTPPKHRSVSNNALVSLPAGGWGWASQVPGDAAFVFRSYFTVVVFPGGAV